MRQLKNKDLRRGNVVIGIDGEQTIYLNPKGQYFAISLNLSWLYSHGFSVLESSIDLGMSTDCTKDIDLAEELETGRLSELKHCFSYDWAIDVGGERRFVLMRDSCESFFAMIFDGKNKVYLRRIKFIHELQNLFFGICGKEVLNSLERMERIDKWIGGVDVDFGWLYSHGFNVWESKRFQIVSRGDGVDILDYSIEQNVSVSDDWTAYDWVLKLRKDLDLSIVLKWSFTEGKFMALLGNAFELVEIGYYLKKADLFDVVAALMDDVFMADMAMEKRVNSWLRSAQTEIVGDGDFDCDVCGRKKVVWAYNEADVGVAVISSSEPKICEICMNSDDEEVKNEIEKLINGKGDMPF